MVGRVKRPQTSPIEDLVRFIEKRISILREAEEKYTGNPNPWKHRCTEAELILGEVRAYVRKAA